MNQSEVFRLSTTQLGLLEHVVGAPRAMLNMPTRIDLESEIDEERVLEAMRLTVTRLPFCTIRMHELPDGGYEQYLWYGEPEGIELVDLSSESDEQVDGYIQKLAGTPFENNCNDSQLYTFKLIRRANNRHTIYFCGYHIIMDTFALIHVITYFDKVYAALTNGTELPAPGAGPERHIEESWAYKGSEKEKRDLAWWAEQFPTEPHFASMNPAPSDEYIEGKNYGKALTLMQMRAVSLPLRIPAELVNKAADAALANNISPQLYYFLALRTWLSLNSGCDDVIVGTTGARRSTKYAKDCGLTVDHMILWRSVIHQDCSFRDALHLLSNLQKDSYRHINAALSDYETPMLRKFHTPKDGIYRSIVFTYQPYFDVKNTNLRFTAEHVNIGVTPYPLYLNIMPRDGSGDLWADYIYASGYLKPENLDRFHRFMLRFVPAGIDAPDQTIGQLVKETLY